MKRYTEAENDFNKAIEINPLYDKAYYNRGILKEELGYGEGALEDYNKAIEINPQYAGAYYNRGLLKVKSGDVEGAKQDLAMAEYLIKNDNTKK